MACFQQGGCLSPVPPQFELDVDGSKHRLNIMYYPLAVHGPQLTPFDLENLSFVPQALADRGLSKSDWTLQVEKLREIALLRHGSCVDYCGCMSYCLCPVLWPECCSCTSRIALWDQRLKEWQDQFNEITLNRLGIHVKTKSHCIAVYSGGLDESGTKVRHFYRWLTFALCELEIVRLKEEPHLTGDIETSACCGGIDESKYCVHPVNQRFQCSDFCVHVNICCRCICFFCDD